jgi:hypothetical protein
MAGVSVPPGPPPQPGGLLNYSIAGAATALYEVINPSRGMPYAAAFTANPDTNVSFVVTNPFVPPAAGVQYWALVQVVDANTEQLYQTNAWDMSLGTWTFFQCVSGVEITINIHYVAFYIDGATNKWTSNLSNLTSNTITPELPTVTPPSMSAPNVSGPTYGPYPP